MLSHRNMVSNVAQTRAWTGGIFDDIDRVVAIKILQPERRGEEHFRAWFLREARAVNRINHANIVDINDVESYLSELAGRFGER